jgi:hypothetical protein
MLSLALLLLTACSKEPETIIKTADGKGLTAEDIDAEPLALLPGGAVGIAYLDAPQLFASQFGPKLTELTRKVAPLPASTGFEPARDLERLYVGMYSMQGIDCAGVAVGKFDPEAIARAGERADRTPQGVPIVKSEYGGRTLYTSSNVGFVVLTSKTALFGNETGIRRALDRINEGRVERKVPAWVEDLLEQPNAPIAGAMNLRAQPVTEGARKNFPFLEGMHMVRFVGNFQAPGINFAGTAVYDDEAGAGRGDQAMRDFHGTLQSMTLVASLFGIPQPVKRFETQVQGKEVQFVAGIDGQAVSTLLDMASRALPAPPAGGG